MPEEYGAAVSFIRSLLAARRFIHWHARRTAAPEDCAQAGWVSAVTNGDKSRVRAAIQAAGAAEKGTT